MSVLYTKLTIHLRRGKPCTERSSLSALRRVNVYGQFQHAGTVLGLPRALCDLSYRLSVYQSKQQPRRVLCKLDQLQACHTSHRHIRIFRFKANHIMVWCGTLRLPYSVYGLLWWKCIPSLTCTDHRRYILHFDWYNRVSAGAYWSPHGSRKEDVTDDKSIATCILPVLKDEHWVGWI